MNLLDKKTFAIGLLALSAVGLLIANLMQPSPARAADSVRGRDFQAVTARTVKGGDALYLTDSRSGLVAIFVYNPTRRQVENVAIEPMAKVFQSAIAPVPGPRR